MAVLGRPNVGKSTLINRILGEERVLALDIPGTTRDTIFIPFEREDEQYTLIDTAGIRRKRSVEEKVEKFSIIKAIEALEDSHVVILVLDAHEGVTEQDATLLGMIADKGRALLIVINKWDGLDDYQRSEVKRKLEMLSFHLLVMLRFITFQHFMVLVWVNCLTHIRKSFEHAGAKFSTPSLNKILEKANNNTSSPSSWRKEAKTKICPPI